MLKTNFPFDLATPVRDPLSQPLLLDFVGGALANILNLTDPDPRRQRVLMVPPKRLPHMPSEMMALINRMSETPKGRGNRFDSPSRLRAIYFLLKSAQCRLCARGRDQEDLLLSYLKSRSSFGLIGSSVTGAEEKHRQKFRGIEFLASAKGARTLVIDILAETFGKALLTSSASEDVVANVRTIIRPADNIYTDSIDELLVLDVLGGFFDFQHHSDAQIVDTVETVARLARPCGSSHAISKINDLISSAESVEPAVASYLPPQFRK